MYLSAIARSLSKLRWLATAVLFVVIVAAMIALQVYQARIAALRSAEAASLHSIAHVKANQLAALRSERLIDNSLYAGRPEFNDAIATWLAHPTPAGAETIRRELAPILATGIYTNLAIFDAAGQQRLDVYPDRPLPRCAPLDKLLLEVYTTQTSQIGDVYRCAPDMPLQWDVAAPLVVQQGSSPVLVGALVSSVDVPAVVFPLVDEWPVPSASGEMVVMARQGDSLINLTPYRNGPAPLDFRTAITQTELASVQAALSPAGGVTGRANRGAGVMAAAAAVPDAPWYVLAEKNLAEIDAPIADQSGWFVLGTVSTIALFTALLAVLALLLRQRTLQQLYAMEQSRRSSEEKLAAFFRSSPVAVCVSRLDDGRCVDVNEVFVDWFGYGRAELIGHTLVEVGLFSAAARSVLMTAMQNGRIVNAEVDGITKSGAIKHCLLSAEALDGVDGRLMLSVLVDVTGERQIQDALHKSEERLRLALEAANQGLWDWDLATGEVFSDDLSVAMLGYVPGDIAATNDLWINSLHPDDAARALQTVDDYVRGRAAEYDSEYRVITRSGEIRWHHSVGEIVDRAADGTPLRIIGINADITERKQAELALVESERKYRDLYDKSPDMYFSMHPDDHLIVDCNLTLANTLGYARQELIGQSAVLLFDAASIPKIAAILPSLMKTYQVSRIDAQLLHKNGTVLDVILTAGLEPHAGGGRSLGLMTLHDISERKRMEDALRTSEETLRTSEEALRQANEALEWRVAERTAELRRTVAELELANAGKDAFLAAISHELRTPLMGVLSMSELMAEEIYGPLNNKQARGVAAIYESGKRLLSTINSVLQYTNLVAGKTSLIVEPCLMAELCTHAVHSLLLESKRKRQTITQQIEPVGLQIESDPQAILDILRRLLENAVKFTPEEGRIDLNARSLPDTDSIVLSVSDTGVGMSEEQMADLFRPFSQGDKSLSRRFEGLGLGLAYVAEAVKRLGGSVAVSSQLNQGSCFTLMLPRKALPAQQQD